MIKSSRSNWFLSCFGHKMKLADQVNSSSRRRISYWTFSFKKSSTKNSVNDDFNSIDCRKPNPVNEAPVKSDEENQKTSRKKVTDVVTRENGSFRIRRKPNPVNDAPAKSDEENQKTCRKKWTDVVTRENGSFRIRRKPNPVKEAPAKSDEQNKKTSRKKLTDVITRENGSFRIRRRETKPDTTSASGAGVESPVRKSVSSGTKPLTQSKPVPAPSKLPEASSVEGTDVSKTTTFGGEFDSIIAMLILLTILLIMVLWGKLCAIVCTCTWFLVAPRLAAAGGRAAGGCTAEIRRPELGSEVNLESVEYKKKVVLEGLLQRNHRNAVVGRL